MPPAMVATWLTTGAVLVICLLFLTALLPRTNAEYAISALPFAAGSEEHDSSRLALGKEGTKDEQAIGGKGTRRRPDKDLKSGGVQKVAHPERGDGEISNADHSTDGQAKGNDSQGKNSSGQKSKSDSSGNDQSNDKGPRGQSGGKGNSNDAGSRSEQSDKSGSKEEAEQSRGQASKPQMDEKSDEAKSASHRDAPKSPTPENAESSSTADTSELMEDLMGILKWVFYGALIGIALWWSWRYRAGLIQWLRDLLQGWGFFGRQRRPDEAAIAAPTPLKSFLDFSDPFASGMAGRMTLQDLVRYSFEALEAWARDNGCPRGADETPLEFARHLGSSVEHLAKPARALAEMYSVVAYSTGTLPPTAEGHLRKFWETLTERARPPEWSLNST